MKESRAICTSPEVWAGVSCFIVSELRRPITFDLMLAVDESDFTPDHIEQLEEWADKLGISVEVLLGRIVLAASEGEKYI